MIKGFQQEIKQHILCLPFFIIVCVGIWSKGKTRKLSSNEKPFEAFIVSLDYIILFINYKLNYSLLNSSLFILIILVFVFLTFCLQFICLSVISKCLLDVLVELESVFAFMHQYYSFNRAWMMTEEESES